MSLEVALVMENLPASAGDLKRRGGDPGPGRSAGGGHGSPLLYSCLENPMERSLVGSSPRGHKELDMTQVTYTHTH